MAKRPQKRSSELSAPQLQQPVFDVTSQPVNTAIDPGAAGAPAKPVMQQDAVRPDLGPSQDMARMGQALSGLSRTVRDLATLEELRTQEAQKDAERLVTETDLSIAELVDQGKLTGVTPAHIRGRGRALSNQATLELANKYEADKTALRTTEGALEPDYMEKWLRKTAEEQRASLRMAGVNEGYFNKRFNENFGRLLQKVNADHNAWAGKEHQSRAVSDAKDSLITLANTVPYDPSSENSQLYDAMYDLIEGRVDGRMTRRGTNIAIGQSAVDIMVEDPSMIPTMEFVLDNMPTGPILLPESFDPTTSVRNKLGLPTDDSRKGRLGKIAEVSNYRNEKQARINSGVSTRKAQTARQEFSMFGSQVEARVREAAVTLLDSAPRSTTLDLATSQGGATATEFANQIIAANPELKEYYDKGVLNIRPTDNGNVLFENTETGSDFTLNIEDELKEAQALVRDRKIQQGSAVESTTEQSVRVNVAIEMGSTDPRSIEIMSNGVSLITRSSAEMATMINNLPNIEGVRADPAFAAFEQGYQEYSAYAAQNLSGYLSKNENLNDAVVLYDIYRHMIREEGHSPAGAFGQIVEAVERQSQFTGSTAGLREQMERQIPREELQLIGEEVKDIATKYLFLRGGKGTTPAQAINFAEDFVKRNTLHLGGTRLRITSFDVASKDSLGPNSDFTKVQAVLGGKNVAGLPVAKAFNTGSPAVERLFGKQFIDDNAPDGRMNIVRFEPVDPNDLTAFRMYQSTDGISGERQVLHPNRRKRPDGSFTLDELLEVGAVEIPGINATTLEEAARKAKVKEDSINMRRPSVLVKLLSNSTNAAPVVESFFAVTVPDQSGSPRSDSKTVEVATGIIDQDPAVVSVLNEKPWMLYFFSTDGTQVFDQLRPEKGSVEFSKNQTLRSRLGSGEIPSELGRAFMDPDVLLAYQNLTDEEKETIPDLSWMGDLNESVPSMFKLRQEGILDGGIPRTVERIGNTVVDFTGTKYGSRSLLSAAKTGDAAPEMLLLADLMQSSPEGRAYLKTISESPFGTEVDLSKAMTMEAADKFLYEFTEEERETLGRRFDFFYDPRFIVEREEKENERLLENLDLEAQQAAKEIAEDMNK